MRLGSDTLDEEQEKAEFFRVRSLFNKILSNKSDLFFILQELEENKGQNKLDYGILHHEIELDLSPTRNGTGKKTVCFKR